MTDVASDDPSNSAMMALLPTTNDWCKADLPHMTLVYAGLLDNLKPTVFNEMAKDAASIAMMSSGISLSVSGVEVFGDVDKVNVLRLRASSELLAMRQMVEHWNASQFPFKAHATIGPMGSVVENVPGFLFFDRIMVGWGDDNLTFWLKR